MKLHKIIALVQGKKARASKLLTTIHRSWGRERITGISRTYTPKHEDGEQFHPESRVVQLHVKDEIEKIKVQLSEFFNIVATQEATNCGAGAKVAVDGYESVGRFPVTVLLFLDKQLVELRTLAQQLPTLPTDREWSRDEAKNCWVTAAEHTVKTQKVVEPIVKYPATKEHPAQTDLINKDKTIGHWATIHLSGALTETERDAIVSRIENLQDAVKVAREEANSVDAIHHDIGGKILNYIFTSE